MKWICPLTDTERKNSHNKKQQQQKTDTTLPLTKVAKLNDQKQSFRCVLSLSNYKQRERVLSHLLQQMKKTTSS